MKCIIIIGYPYNWILWRQRFLIGLSHTLHSFFTSKEQYVYCNFDSFFKPVLMEKLSQNRRSCLTSQPGNGCVMICLVVPHRGERLSSEEITSRFKERQRDKTLIQKKANRRFRSGTACAVWLKNNLLYCRFLAPRDRHVSRRWHSPLPGPYFICRCSVLRTGARLRTANSKRLGAVCPP